jgi:hypothetical protein
MEPACFFSISVGSPTEGDSRPARSISWSAYLRLSLRIGEIAEGAGAKAVNRRLAARHLIMF